VCEEEKEELSLTTLSTASITNI